MDYLVFLMDRFVTHTDENGYKRVPTTIVFVQNKRSSDSVAIWLLRRGFRATALNSDRDMKTRLRAVRGIQSGHFDIVVATDVLARGVNIPGVKTVINYELPVQSHVNYIHRIGRAARMGNIGRAISIFDTCKNTNLAPYLEKVSLILRVFS
jgi:superfamily II DNA/RNA helicase